MSYKDRIALEHLKAALKEGDLLPKLLKYGLRAPGSWASWPVNRCLWYLRKRMHLTQHALAGKAGIPRSHVARLEAGYDVNLSTLARLFEALGLGLLIVPTRGLRHTKEPWTGPWRRPKTPPAARGRTRNGTMRQATTTQPGTPLRGARLQRKCGDQ